MLYSSPPIRSGVSLWCRFSPTVVIPARHFRRVSVRTLIAFEVTPRRETKSNGELERQSTQVMPAAPVYCVEMKACTE